MREGIQYLKEHKDKSVEFNMRIVKLLSFLPCSMFNSCANNRNLHNNLVVNIRVVGVILVS